MNVWSNHKLKSISKYFFMISLFYSKLIRYPKTVKCFVVDILRCSYRHWMYFLHAHMCTSPLSTVDMSNSILKAYSPMLSCAFHTSTFNFTQWMILLPFVCPFLAVFYMYNFIICAYPDRFFAGQLKNWYQCNRRCSSIFFVFIDSMKQINITLIV